MRTAGIKYTPAERDYKPREARSYRLVPSKRLIARLGLSSFDGPAPLTGVEWNIDEIGILLSQHVGAPAQPVVQAGDAVTAGQMVGAIREGSLGAPVHTSMDGVVTEVTDSVIKIKVGSIHV